MRAWMLCESQHLPEEYIVCRRFLKEPSRLPPSLQPWNRENSADNLLPLTLTQRNVTYLCSSLSGTWILVNKVVAEEIP